MGFGDTGRCKSAHGCDRRALRPATGGQRVVPGRLVLERASGTQLRDPGWKVALFPAHQFRVWRISERPARNAYCKVRACRCELHGSGADFGIHRRFEVPQPTRFFTGASGSLSPLFSVQLPPHNLFGVDESIVPELVLSPSGEQGYYLFVRPLPPGDHVVRWVASGCLPGLTQDIRYQLTVVGH